MESMNEKVLIGSPNEQGYYGSFGGAYIPEMLHRNVEEQIGRASCREKGESAVGDGTVHKKRKCA